jgi:hypothetical protein
MKYSLKTVKNPTSINSILYPTKRKQKKQIGEGRKDIKTKIIDRRKKKLDEIQESPICFMGF